MPEDVQPYSRVYPPGQAFRAEAVAAALVQRGFRRRSRALDPGDVLVIKRPNGEVELRWFPLVWDEDMLRRLENLAAAEGDYLAGTRADIRSILRELSRAFPNRALALQALSDLEALAGIGRAVH